MIARIVLSIILLLFLHICGISQNIDSTFAEYQYGVQVPRYKLYKTENIWTFLHLDTKIGTILLLQYSVEDDNRFTMIHTLMPKLITDEYGLVNGRYELYPTSNMYNFILLDQIVGDTWQVQWSQDEENMKMWPIE